MLSGVAQTNGQLRPVWVDGDAFLERLWDEAVDESISKQCYRLWGFSGTVQALARVLDHSGLELTEHEKIVLSQGMVDLYIGAWGRRKIAKGELFLKCMRTQVSFEEALPFRWSEFLSSRSKVKKIPYKAPFRVLLKGVSAIIPGFAGHHGFEPVYCTVDVDGHSTLSIGEQSMAESVSGGRDTSADFRNAEIGCLVFQSAPDHVKEVNVMSKDESIHQTQNIQGGNSGTVNQTAARNIADSLNQGASIENGSIEKAVADLSAKVAILMEDKDITDEIKEAVSHEFRMVAAESKRGGGANKDTLLASGKGLIRASKTAAVIAPSIVIAVKSILSLFGINLP